MRPAAWNESGGCGPRPPCGSCLWAALLVACLATALGSGALVGLIALGRRLHRPMYRLLAHLALLDTAYVSTTLPQALAHMTARRATLSPARCGAQRYVGISLGSCEALLPAAMAPDRCLALPAVPRTACADTSANQLLVYSLGTPILLVPLTFILASYALILAAVGKLPSAESRLKALSTCGSHLAVVGLFYGTVTAMYLRPRGSSALPARRHKLVAAFYLVVTPVLNPLIYSLRNREVRAAARYALARLRGLRSELR
nr:olfactory receptor 2AG2-like [Vicugna pacos]